MHRVYLDNNATTPVLPEVFEAMKPYFGEHFGNASSIHHHGQETRAAVERARESVAALLGCRSSEIVFTSGGTEADNLAIFGLAAEGDHVITSSIEHHAVLNACRRLEETGCEVTYVPVGANGQVSPDDVKGALRPNTKLISVMMANNETGVLQPVEPIGTENVPGIVGLGKAAEIAAEAFRSGGVESIGQMRDRIQATILAVEATGVNGEGASRVPNTANIYFDHIEGEALVIALDLKGLSVSTGAACSSGAIEPSHVLTAMGVTCR